MTQVVTNSGGHDSGTQDSTQKIWMDGTSAKIEYETSSNPMMEPGSYMLVQDGGKKIFLVNPKAKTYALLDLMAMGSGMEAMGGSGGAMEMKIEDPRMEKVLEEPGESILGHKTTHYRYHTTYTMTIAMAMMKTAMATDILEDVWTSPAIDLGATGQAAMAHLTGGAMMKELAQLGEAQRAKQTGMQLKRIVVTTSKSTSRGGMGAGMLARMVGGGGRNSGGGDSTTTMTNEVTELAEIALPPSTFQIPAGYAETEMMQRGPAMPDLGREQH